MANVIIKRLIEEGNEAMVLVLVLVLVLMPVLTLVTMPSVARNGKKWPTNCPAL
jgi:hypothetical protein